MKLEYFEEFLMLANTGNYSIAAEKLYVSVSSLSRHIMLLERDIGAELFCRGPRTVSISEAGRLLIPYARKIVAARTEYLEALHEMRGDTRQELTIGFSRTVVQYGVMEMLIRFRKENPDISVVFTGNDPSVLIRMTKAGECNFAICCNYSFFDTTGLELRVLVDDTLAVALPISHPLASNDAVFISQLKDEQFVMSQEGNASFLHAMELFTEAGFSPKVATFTEGGELGLNLVSKGAGISLIALKRFAECCPPNVKIIRIDPPVGKNVVLFYKKRPLGDVETRFLSFMQNHFCGSVPVNANGAESGIN